MVNRRSIPYVVRVIKYKVRAGLTPAYTEPGIPAAMPLKIIPHPATYRSSRLRIHILYWTEVMGTTHWQRASKSSLDRQRVTSETVWELAIDSAITHTMYLREHSGTEVLSLPVSKTRAIARQVSVNGMDGECR
jgi:hypothetical protein